MNHSTHPSPAERAVDSFTTEPHFAPTPGTLVALFSAELPARYLLLCHTEERDGFHILCLAFNARLTPAERVQAVRRTEAVPADLVELVAEEILERGAQAVAR